VTVRSDIVGAPISVPYINRVTLWLVSRRTETKSSHHLVETEMTQFLFQRQQSTARRCKIDTAR